MLIAGLVLKTLRNIYKSMIYCIFGEKNMKKYKEIGKRNVVWKKIWGKIAVMAIVAMFVGCVFGVFGSVDAVEEDSSNWGELATEEITMHNDGRIERSTEIIFDGQCLSILQDPDNPGSRPLIYTPPWDYRYIHNETVQWGGLVIGGWQGGVDGYQGWTDIATEAGPGAGEISITVWIHHGFYFTAPVTDTYTFTFDYRVQGKLYGLIWGFPIASACASSEVALFFNVGSTQKREDILYDQTIPIIWESYTHYFDESRTVGMQVQLYEGNLYLIQAIAGIQGRSVAGMYAQSLSYDWLDDLDVSGWSDGAILEKVTVDWPNHPPNKPSKPSGPADGIIGEEYTFTTSTTDPDGIGDSLWYKFLWSDGDSGWIGPYASGETASASHSWANKGTYQIRVLAKDSYGALSPLSDSIWFIVRDPPPDVEITRPDPGIYILDSKFMDLAVVYIIIGRITIEVDASDIGSGMNRVEFWINGDKKYTDYTEPYKWTWQQILHNIYSEIKVKAYDEAGNSASDTIYVWKYF